MDSSRIIKPAIPLVGNNGIPLKHEIVFEMGMPLREEYADEKNKKTSVYSNTRDEFYSMRKTNGGL